MLETEIRICCPSCATMQDLPIGKIKKGVICTGCGAVLDIEYQMLSETMNKVKVVANR